MDTTDRRTGQKLFAVGRHAHRAVVGRGGPDKTRVGPSAGLTLVELMIALIILTFMTSGLLVFTTMLQRMEVEYGVQTKLANEARVALDKMVWGTRAAGVTDRHGIWEARTLTVVSPEEVLFTDTAATLHRVRRNGLKIQTQDGDNAPWKTLLDLNGAAADDAGTNSLSLDFTSLAQNVLQIRMVVGQRVVGRWHYASLSTQINARNV